MLFFAGPESRVKKALQGLFADVLERTTRDLEGVKTLHDLAAKVVGLQQQVSNLEIIKAQKQEEFDRREREVEHKVGLERKRQEFELTAAKREASVTIREENLKADRARFEEQMKFHEDRFSEEVKYLKEMIGQVLARVPDVTATLNVGGTDGTHTRTPRRAR